MSNLLKKSTNYLIVFFAFVLVSFSTIETFREGGLYNAIGIFIHSGVLHYKFFTPFELIIFLLLLNLLINYKVKFKFKNGLFLFAFLAFLIRMFNPNADSLNPIFGLPLLSNISEYAFLFLLLVFISLPLFLSQTVLKSIFKYAVIFAVIKSIYLIIIYFFGKVTTVRWGNYAVILDEPDTQVLFSFLGSMMFTLFLIHNKRKYLLISLLLLGITFMSVQRSTVLPGLFSVFIIIITSLLVRIPLIAKRTLAIISLSLLFILFFFVTETFSDSKFSFAMNRFISAIVAKEEVQHTAFSDTGHKEQSIITFLSAIENNVFFGVGYGRSDDLFLKGQTANIHNAYAGIWAHHGIISLLFYLTILLIIIRRTIKLVSVTNRSNFRFFLPKLAASFYLIGYYFSAWFTPEGVFNNFRWQVFWVMILMFVTNYSVNSNRKIIHERKY